jgi:hypothetical protein
MTSRLARWFRRHEPVDSTPSAAALAAEKAVRESRLRAESDLATQRRQLAEAEEVRGVLRAHNDANHYADWLLSQGLAHRGNR